MTHNCQKILNIREEYDGTVRAITEDHELKYCTDEDVISGPKHKVFDMNYRETEKRIDFKDTFYYSSSIIGWTSIINEELILISPWRLQEKYRRTKHLYEDIFPVIVGSCDSPLLSFRTDPGKKKLLKKVMNENYGPYFQFLTWVEHENPLKSRITVRVGQNDVMTVERLGSDLTYCRVYQSEGDLKMHWHKVHRILDKKRNPTDYDVFGMFAGGPKPPIMTFNGQQIQRLCYDHRIPVMDESGQLIIRDMETFQWYGSDKKSGFRTEPSYNWRFRRTGFYCSLNSLLLVDELFGDSYENTFLSLLRESTFVISDGMCSYLFTQTDQTFIFRDPFKHISLGSLIVVITEGLYTMRIKVCPEYPQMRSIYFSLKYGVRRPLLLNWSDFEDDFSPNGPTADPYVQRQHKLRILMKTEEFWDYVVFRPINTNKELIECEILCILAQQPNVGHTAHNIWNQYWHFYHVFHEPYFYYLSTHWLSSRMERGVFEPPFVNDDIFVGRRIFPETIDFNEYPDIPANLHNQYNQDAIDLNQWWMIHGTVNQGPFYNACHSLLATIYELKSPTTKALMRVIKTQSFYKFVENSLQQKPTLNQFRPYFNRFRQVVWGHQLYDWQIFTSHHNTNPTYAFAMYDYPELNINPIIEIIDKWDVYSQIGFSRNTRDFNNFIFHYMGSVRYRYIYSDTNNTWTSDPPSFVVFDVLYRDNGINSTWYPNCQNLVEKAIEMETYWRENINERNADLEKYIHQLMPLNSQYSGLRRPTYYGRYRENIFHNPYYS